MDSFQAVFCSLAKVAGICNNFLYLRCFLWLYKNFQRLVLSV